jgi:hypothetical protein
VIERDPCPPSGSYCSARCRAHRGLAIAWWTLTAIRALLPAAVRMADLIIVVQGSRVTEFGTHDTLMARNGTYAELYTIQARAYR